MGLWLESAPGAGSKPCAQGSLGIPPEGREAQGEADEAVGGRFHGIGSRVGFDGIEWDFMRCDGDAFL